MPRRVITSVVKKPPRRLFRPLVVETGRKWSKPWSKLVESGRNWSKVVKTLVESGLNPVSYTHLTLPTTPYV